MGSSVSLDPKKLIYHRNTQFFQLAAGSFDPVWGIVLQNVAVKAHGHLHAASFHGFDQFFVFKELLYVLVLLELVLGVVIHIQLPEDVLLLHLFEEFVPIQTVKIQVSGQIHMGNAGSLTTAPLGKGQHIVNDGTGEIEIFDIAVIEHGYIHSVWHQGKTLIHGGDLHTAPYFNLILILVSQDFDMLVVPLQRGIVGDDPMLIAVIGNTGPVHHNAVIVVANAQKLDAAFNGLFDECLRRILAAVRVIGVRMYVLNHVLRLRFYNVEYRRKQKLSIKPAYASA